MSTPVGEIIEGRPRDVGDLVVRRVLPARPRRHVGPFVFLDHMGPVTLPVGRGVDVRPHPHIGLATVTYLFEGEIVHRDSLGSAQAIRPGDVNWMTAGRGIVHSERSAERERATGPRLHGIQSWVALPADDEDLAPSFVHHQAGMLPLLDADGARVRVIAGTAFGLTAPVATRSPLFYVDARMERGATLAVPEHEERGVYVAEGTVELGGVALATGSLAVVEPGAEATLRASADARVMLLGGAPLGERHIYWNFVSSSRERIERAKADWREGRFPKVPGDEHEFTPLPDD